MYICMYITCTYVSCYKSCEKRITDYCGCLRKRVSKTA